MKAKERIDNLEKENKELVEHIKELQACVNRPASYTGQPHVPIPETKIQGFNQ